MPIKNCSGLKNEKGEILRTCIRCARELPLSEFDRSGIRYKDYCKNCEALYERMRIPVNDEKEYDVANFIYNAF